jgi:hypothetical protein
MGAGASSPAKTKPVGSKRPGRRNEKQADEDSDDEESKVPEVTNRRLSTAEIKQLNSKRKEKESLFKQLESKKQKREGRAENSDADSDEYDSDESNDGDESNDSDEDDDRPITEAERRASNYDAPPNETWARIDPGKLRKVKPSPQRRLKIIDVVSNKVFVNELNVNMCNVRESIRLKRPEISFISTNAVAIVWELKSAVQRYIRMHAAVWI